MNTFVSSFDHMAESLRIFAEAFADPQRSKALVGDGRPIGAVDQERELHGLQYKQDYRYGAERTSPGIDDGQFVDR